jgi:beta-galactosidase
VADIYTPHYPTTAQIADFYQRADRPVIFTEYCHTLGISLEDHDRQWEIIERTPCIAGGSVWEWVDQGMPFRVKSKEVKSGKRFGYEERVFTSKEGGFEMFGNKGTDGLLYADRTPLPNYYELQHNYARAFVSDCKDGTLTIVNRYDFLNLKDNVTFHWTLTNNRNTIMSGAFSPDCQPHDYTFYTLNLPKQKGLSLLQFDIEDTQGNIFLHQSFVLNKPTVSWLGSGEPMKFVQEGPLVRVGRKATMAEILKVKDKRIEKYLQPLDNPYVKADVKTSSEGNAIKVTYTLTPDTTEIFLSELGIAYLLDERFDRVQWVGYGPFASYPGRHQANRYGFWAKQMGDLYFEGNRMGVDAALFSDKEGNGLLVVGDSLNMNFEQTDLGIVMTVNAAVSGQGPKFARTAFPVISKHVGTIKGDFCLYCIDAHDMPQTIKDLFLEPQTVPAPFHPFETQYDTYLLKYNDIKQ